MSTNIKLKRSAVADKQPNTSVLELGELAINTYDGKLFLKKDNGAESIVDIGSDAETLDGANSSFYLDFTNFTSIPSPTITLSGDASGSVTLTDLANGNLTVSVNDDSHNHSVANGDFTVTQDLTIQGGIITLEGSGRITGVDTVVTATDAVNKEYVDQAVQSGGAGGFVVSTVTSTPGAEEDYDLSYDSSQTVQEVPFDAGGADAFGVSLGQIYDGMEPIGRFITINYGAEEAYVGA